MLRFLLTLLYILKFIEAAEETPCHRCNKGKRGNVINVHIIPHSHDDVGWLKTPDQYFYGTKEYIHRAGVKLIYDSVLSAMSHGGGLTRRFVIAETAFFSQWWERLNDYKRQNFRELVYNGSIEFVGAGWSMNDEAVTHYQSIIDQFTLGLRKSRVVKCGAPRVAWQIDPFGHSQQMISMLIEIGYEALIFGRVQYLIQNDLLSNKSADFYWNRNINGKSEKLFVTILPNTYMAPPYFCFDYLCNDEVMVENKNSSEYNMEARADQFIQILKRVASFHRTNQIMIPMGGDFTFMNAHKQFFNIELLIKAVNRRQQKKGPNFFMFFSTPSCYVEAVLKRLKQTKAELETLNHSDLFPHASDPHAFWTGYYTSRPTLKRFERLGNNFLQVCKQLFVFGNLSKEHEPLLSSLMQTMGVLQHHDAITGTSKQHVAENYARMLSIGINDCDVVANQALNDMSSNKVGLPKLNYKSCFLLNISQCEVTETTDKFLVTVYNPLSRIVTHYVRFPVTGKAYEVLNPKGRLVATQLLEIPDPVLNIPGRISKAERELMFLANDIPPLGYKTYLIKRQKRPTRMRLATGSLPNQTCINIDDATGLLSGITVNNVTMPLTQNFYFYRGTVGNNSEFEFRASGVYIFRPTNSTPDRISGSAKIKVNQGPYVSEVHQKFNKWVSQVIRVYHLENFIEFNWLIGPIPFKDGGKEIISRFTSSLKTDKIFYTDSNGRGPAVQRTRFTNVTEPVSGNYYPVTTKIKLIDLKRHIHLTVLTDRAQGGSSLADGEVELMLHRLCLHDDEFGMGEPLIEEAYKKELVVRGSHYLVVTDDDSMPTEKDVEQRKLLESWTFFAPTNLTFREFKKSYKTEYSGLKHALPDSVQLLTLEPLANKTFLIRLEHIQEYPQNVTIDLVKLFHRFKIMKIIETKLGGDRTKNSKFSSLHNERFESIFPFDKGSTAHKHTKGIKTRSITLEPHQTRTFIVICSDIYLFNRISV